LGCSSIDIPRHAKKYRDFDKIYKELQKERIKAFNEYKHDVLNNKFPLNRHSIEIDKKELDNFKKFFKKKL